MFWYSPKLKEPWKIEDATIRSMIKEEIDKFDSRAINCKWLQACSTYILVMLENLEMQLIGFS